MAINLRCRCGLVIHAEKSDAPACRVCPCCGERLTLEFSARGVPSSGDVDTVAIEPFYAPDVAAEPWRYCVVETPAPQDQKQPTCTPIPLDHATASDDYALEPWSRSEEEKRQLRQFYADASRDIRRRHRMLEPWPLERTGLECFVTALRAGRVIWPLAMAWAVVVPIFLVTLPRPDSDPGLLPWLGRVPFAVILLLLLGLTWSFLRGVLHSGSRGAREWIVDEAFQVRFLVRSACMATAAFLAGPALLLGAMVWFWLGAGAPNWIDQLVIWQLALGAALGWIYLLLAMDARDRLSDFHADAVARQVLCQGWPARVFPSAAALGLVFFLFLQMQLWKISFDVPFATWVGQLLLWMMMMYFWAVLARWYGMSRYWRRSTRVSA